MESNRKPIVITLGGPDDPFPEFPSSTSAKARRHFDRTGQPLELFTTGHYVIDFIENHCVLTDSHYAGQKFALMDWQKRYLLEQFEVHQVDDVWKRVKRWGLVGIPKKNGKTELGAGVGVYLAVDDDEPSPKVVCAAASDDQANLLFGAATKIVEWSPTLSQFAEPHHKHIEFDTGDVAPGELRRVAAVSGSNDVARKRLSSL